MKNRKLLLVASLVLALAVSLGGTLAYLTDTDEAVNVMTLGNVDIEQLELQRAENVPYNAPAQEGNLVTFKQGQALYPAYPQTEDPAQAYQAMQNQDDCFKWGSYVTADVEEGKTAWNGLFNDDDLTGAMDKFVFVENTGSSPAYFRTWLAFECPEVLTFSANNVADADLWVNVNGSDLYTWAWPNEDKFIEIEGVRYLVMCATYKNPLPAGEISRPSLLQVVLTHKADNKDMEALGDTYEILAFTEACQTANMPQDAEKALAAAFGPVTTTTDGVTVVNHPWKDAEGNDYVDRPVLAATADELIEALESGKNVILTDDVKIDPAGMSNAYGTTGINVKNGQTIDGNGNTLDIKGAGGTWDSGINTTGGLIKNITVTGSFRGIFVNHNSTYSEPVVLEKVIIDGTTYTISCDQGMNQTLTAIDCTFNGWTSYAATLGDAKFVNCSFGKGNGYAFCRPYAPTEFVGCEFEAGYRMDARAAVTFENCTLGGVALTAENLATLVTSNTANATVVK